ncbi:B3 domain-containing protein REM1-like [Salvia divinorum]|uniref:B3 domain-containing protein REM1-like n=1 Tax=Salvia divinorum TaxID=28513 RepID=A0ABD1G8X3_SALDI
MADGDAYLTYHRLPSFIKVFSGLLHTDQMGLPPEWVARHRDHLLHDCQLVMPNRTRWPVRLLDIARGCHFCVGWSEFVRDNNTEHGDKLTFTVADAGIFHVKRYKTNTGCPPRGDLGILPEIEEYQGSNSFDVDSSDDYVPSQTGSESADSDDYADDRGVLEDDGYPTWTLKLTKSHLSRTIEIPYEFWQRHIRMNALDEDVYLLVDRQTWRVLLEHSSTKIWIKHGWRHFKDANALVPGVCCHFKLVDAHDVQFYVCFDRP